MKYRAEIDGLRALAVLPVILFHAGFDWFSGGFVGVDVFFVISGYLITTIIINELGEGKFSVVNFYERRARRILPALFFMMLVCLPFAYLWLGPGELKSFGQSLIAVSTFSSNILFWLETGYFDSAAELKPLLHTWSLAVEEQFYILFPLLLMLTWRLGTKWVLILLSLTFFLSLGLAHWGAFNKPTPTFYLLSSRGWELLVGVFAAFYLKHNNHLRSHNINQVFSLLGLGMIGYSIFSFDSNTPFPSLYALVPTIGAGFLILTAVPNTIAHQLLSFSPFVRIGLISYSAYLWHQPILAFARHRLYGDFSEALLVILCLSSLLLAYISWRWVEQPFRNKKIIQRKHIMYFSVIGISFFCSIGLYLLSTQKFDQFVKFGEQTIQIPQKFAGILTEGKKCSSPKLNNPNAVCVLIGKGALVNRNYILLGDSHARTLSEAFFQNINDYSSLTDLTAGGCPFLLGLNIYTGRKKSPCDSEYQQKRRDYVASFPNSHVVYQARLPLYFYGTGFFNEVGGKESISIIASKTLDEEPSARKKDFINSLKRSIRFLAKNANQVTIILPTMTNGWDPIKRLRWVSHIEKDLHAAKEYLKIPKGPVDKRTAAIDEVLLALSTEFKNIQIIDPKALTCANDTCSSLNESGQLLFADPDHLSYLANSILYQAISKSKFQQKRNENDFE